MRDRRVALVLWTAFAFVTWNVAFDRHLYFSAIEFTQEQVERHQRGDAVRTIDTVFRPRVRDAALRATPWGVGVLLAGVIITLLASNRPGTP